MTIVSDGKFRETSVTDAYSKITEGWDVNKRDTNDEMKRYVVTTRNDGSITINVEVSDTTYVNVAID